MFFCGIQSIKSSAVEIIRKPNLLHLKGLSFQVVEDARIRLKLEGQPVRAKRLMLVSVFPVQGIDPIFSIPQQRRAKIGHVRPDLMGPSGMQGHTGQRNITFGFQHLIFCDHRLGILVWKVLHADQVIFSVFFHIMGQSCFWAFGQRFAYFFG